MVSKYVSQLIRDEAAGVLTHLWLVKRRLTPNCLQRGIGGGRDRLTQEMGGGGGGGEEDCHHQNHSCIKIGSDESYSNASLIAGEETVSTDNNNNNNNNILFLAPQ